MKKKKIKRMGGTGQKEYRRKKNVDKGNGKERGEGKQRNLGKKLGEKEKVNIGRRNRLNVGIYLEKENRREINVDKYRELGTKANNETGRI